MIRVFNDMFLFLFNLILLFRRAEVLAQSGIDNTARGISERAQQDCWWVLIKQKLTLFTTSHSSLNHLAPEMIENLCHYSWPVLGWFFLIN